MARPISFKINYFDCALGINFTTENMDFDRFEFVLNMLEHSGAHADVVPYEVHEDGREYHYYQ